MSDSDRCNEYFCMALAASEAMNFHCFSISLKYCSGRLQAHHETNLVSRISALGRMPFFV
ncbi:hypothetical protein F9L08_23660 [Brucella tritici]|uniref:Uncharacterized protein n=1 Tax=Brucella tritici TaxID=94626 RepID=A0A6L3Y7D2_9HYPH|nr:hypothetical protein F9L08_23660 [Brucella tritici]